MGFQYTTACILATQSATKSGEYPVRLVLVSTVSVQSQQRT